jgi:hypothetical protein
LKWYVATSLKQEVATHLNGLTCLSLSLSASSKLESAPSEL